MRLRKLLATTDGRRPLVVAFAMLFAAAINVYQFAGIDAGLGKKWKALYAFESFDIMKIGLKTSPHVRQSHNLFAAIGQEAPGARFIITTPRLGRTNWFRNRMIGVGLSASIDVCELDPHFVAQLDSEVDLTAMGTVSSRGMKAKQPDLIWGITSMSSEPRTLLQVETADFDVLILDADVHGAQVYNCK